MGNTDTLSWNRRVAKLYRYWSDIGSDNGGIPDRAEFDPTAIFQILPWVWMVDVQHDPMRFKFRLMGTQNVEQMQRDVTGLWIDEAYPEFTSGTGYKDYLDVVHKKDVSYRRGPSQYHVANYKNIERIMLPMTDGGEDVDIILAITVYD